MPVLKSLTKLTYDTLGSAYEASLNISDELDINKQNNLRQLAFKVGIKCEELLEICRYKDEVIPCCEYFQPLYSEHGLCYSFNARYYGTPEEEQVSFLSQNNDGYLTDYIYVSLGLKMTVSTTCLRPTKNGH